MAARSDLLVANGGGSVSSRLDFGGASGGSGISQAGVAVAPPPVSSAPTQRFDLSVLSGLRESDKYLGRNRVSEIKESYDTYLTGVPVGRGGVYATDAARRYGTSIREAARGYLVSAGLLPLADVAAPVSAPPKALEEKDFFELPVPPSPTTAREKGTVELLLDALPRLFGNAAASTPLQSQAYGYTPVSGDFGGSGGSSGGAAMWLLLGAVAIAAYFVYKRYS
jgi:hypothetical protein